MVEQKQDTYRFVMYEKARSDPGKIPTLLEKYRGDLNFKMEEPPVFIYQKKGISAGKKDGDVLELVKKLLIDIKGLLA